MRWNQILPHACDIYAHILVLIFQFEFKTKPGDNPVWAAVALPDDSETGDDSLM